MSLVAFERYGDRFPPERELLSVEADGSFRMWRSFGAAAAGRFAGAVADVAALADLAERALAADPPGAGTVEADGSVEIVTAGAVKVEVEAGARVPGPWGELLARLRQLLDELVSQPLATVGGRLDRGGAFHLEHGGSAVLPLELGHLRVRVVRWSGGVEAAVAEGSPGGLGHVEAGPGWALDVPFDGVVVGGGRDGGGDGGDGDGGGGGGGRVVGTATFVAVDDGVYVPVVVTAHLR